jgi:hypothetical protein
MSDNLSGYDAWKLRSPYEDGEMYGSQGMPDCGEVFVKMICEGCRHERMCCVACGVCDDCEEVGE